MIHYISKKQTCVEEMIDQINELYCNGKDDAFSDTCEKAQNKCKTQEDPLLLKKINDHYALNVYTEIPFKNPIIVFIAKVIRKVLRWHISGLATQQQDFNSYVTQYLNAKALESETEKQELKEQYKELKEQYKELSELAHPSSVFSDSWYIDFENTFRGSQDEITKRLETYLPYYDNCSKALDIGCGRGELLEILRNHNISAQGIDLNNAMVRECQGKNLDVTYDDALTYLEKCEDDSYDVINMTQVVEHLPLNELYKVIKASYSKIKTGGRLIMETVNPLCLGVFCYGFYIDPTHTKPIHPAMLRFMIEEIGFKADPIQFVHNFPDEYKFKMSENDEDLNNTIQKMNEQIFGAQDYFIVGRK